MYSWWLQEAWNFKLYTRVFHQSLVIKRSTNWALYWSLVTQFIWYILNAPSLTSTIVITLYLMEKFKIIYSKKNNPTASIAQSKLMLTSKIEKFIKRIRQNVLEFLNNLDSNGNKNERCGFKYLKSPHSVEEMAQLENDYCYWLRTSNLRRYIMTFWWGCVMTSKRLKRVIRCLFRPINQDIFIKWEKMKTTNY